MVYSFIKGYKAVRTNGLQLSALTWVCSIYNAEESSSKEYIQYKSIYISFFFFFKIYLV